MLTKKRSRGKKKNSLSNEKENKENKGDKDNKVINFVESPKKSKKTIKKKNNQKKAQIKNSKSNKNKKTDDTTNEKVKKETKGLKKGQKEEININTNKDILNNPIKLSSSVQKINNNLVKAFKDNNCILDNNILTKTNNLPNLNIKENLYNKEIKIPNINLNNKNIILKNNRLDDIISIPKNIGLAKINQNPININYNNNNFIKYNTNKNQITPQINRLNNLVNKNNIVGSVTLFGTFKKQNSIMFRNNNNAKTISITPNYINIFEKINIFNSILIMINNISIINNYFYEDEIINKINICEQNNKFCLSSILYYMNKYLWYSDFKNSKYDLFKAYTDFIKCYTEINNTFNNSLPEKYCYEIKNIELIINFIYNKINEEFTQVNIALKNNSNNSIIYEFNDPLSKYIFDFSQKNNSIISGHFFGFYQYQIYCQNCERNNTMYNMKYNNQYSYNSFSYISFNLNVIKNYKSKKINLSYINYNIFPNFQNNLYNNQEAINLNDCFIFYFNNQNKTIYNNLNCNLCNSNSYKEESLLIFSLPNILTIILSNNDNYNFILQDEINLTNFSKNRPGNSEGKYMLISILCKKIYNDEFICYCVNPNNGLWYSYTNGKIKNVINMDINAVPLILIYQIIDKIEFDYKGIIRNDLNKIKIKFNFMNGIPSKELFFNKNCTIQNIKNEMITYFNLGNYNISLIINGKIIQGNQYLYEVVTVSKEILVVMQKK